MKYFILLTFSVVLFACGGETKESSKNINEVINALEEIHPYNLSPDKTWMIDLNYEKDFLKSYTITQQGGEEITILVDYQLIHKPKSVDYSWIKDKDHGAGFKISSIGTTKHESIELIIFKDGIGIYTAHLLD